MGADAVFRLGSTTKLLSSVTALMLLDHGLLEDLDTPVSAYLPHFDPDVLATPQLPRDAWQLIRPDRPVTLRDLLRHTSGLQYGFGINELDRCYADSGFPRWDRSLAEFVDTIGTLPLAFHPGSQVCYGYGVDLLGRVMEVASGQTLDELTADMLTGPLGMRDTAFFVRPESASRLASHYEFVDGELVPGEPCARFLQLPKGLSAGGGWRTGYGGMVSTVTDLGRLLSMLLGEGVFDNQRFLSRRSIEELFRDQTASVPRGAGVRFPPGLDASGRGFGFGGALSASPGGDLFHWGGAPYNTSFVVSRSLGVYGLLLAQTGPFEAELAPAGMKSSFRQAVLDAAMRPRAG